MEAIVFAMLLLPKAIGLTPDKATNDRLEPAQRQQEAAETVRMYGGQVMFEDGTPCPRNASLAAHRKNAVARVFIADEELVIGAPPGLSVKDCVVKLSYFPKLRYLTLNNDSVDDAMLKHIGHLTTLRELSLIHASISDAGLEHLNGLRALQTLDLTDTKVTDRGVETLRKALPNCKIVR